LLGGIPSENRILYAQIDMFLIAAQKWDDANRKAKFGDVDMDFVLGIEGYGLDRLLNF
jgi:hypothetical protein